MKPNNLEEPVEKLVRLRTPRHGAIVDLLVHYEMRRANGCLVYRIITVNEAG